MAQALEANGAIVYILGRRQEVLEKAASTAVRPIFSQTSQDAARGTCTAKIFSLSLIRRHYRPTQGCE
jgi:hypothetical protein